VAAIDPEAAVTEFTTQEQIRDGNMGRERLLADIGVSGFSGL
jgi:hypothetical protein